VTGRRRVAALAAAVAPLLLSGCAAVNFGSEAVACAEGDDGEPTNGVILMAQSVPTATFVPCLEGMPVGWDFAGLDARSGSASFSLDSDRYGMPAIEIRLTASCDTTGATEIRSERPGMRRMEQISQVYPQFVGRRYYVFDGGCITVVFTLVGPDSSEPIAVATQGLGVVEREVLQELVREESAGRLELDPPVEGDR
jgi:hypothetical protein